MLLSEVSRAERKPFWRGFSRVKLPKLGVNLDSLGTAKDARTKKDCLEVRFLSVLVRIVERRQKILSKV
jgi:hypothetical protein